MTIAYAFFAAGGLVFVSAAVQHLNTVSTRGLGFVFTDRTAPLSRDGFAGRAARTLQNNLESAGMMAPGATLLLVLGDPSGIDGMIALAYAIVRSGFSISYWFGRNRLRSAFWGIGMGLIAVTYGLAGWSLIST